MFIRYSLMLIGLGLLILPLTVRSELRIEITRGVDNAVQIAVVPFEWRGKRQLPTQIDQVISSDLGLSGRFTALPVTQMLSLPNDSTQILPRDWRMLGVEYLVVGYLEPHEVGVRLHFELYDVGVEFTLMLLDYGLLVNLLLHALNLLNFLVKILILHIQFFLELIDNYIFVFLNI